MALEDARNPLKGVSGPGRFAKRTDLQFQPDSYGQGVEMDATIKGAPLAKAPKSPKLSEAPVVPTEQTPITPLYAPSARREEPITTGVRIGKGAGEEALMMRKATEKLSDILVKMLPYDTDGSIAILYQDALARGN